MKVYNPPIPASDFMPADGAAWRARWFHIIFGHECPAGRDFDIVLIMAIMASIVVTVLDSVAGLHLKLGIWFYALEWLFTLTFTLE